jgi:tRNA(Ile)-lysidine synthase
MTMSPQSSSPQNQPQIIQRVVRTIDEYGMLASGESILVGVSGGPDSTALLHILHTLAPSYRLKLAVAHFNHGIRPGAAEDDAVFVQKMAETLRLPFFMERASVLTPTGSLEEQARNARYAFFRALMDKHGQTKIALGHHKDDNAEAVLMNLLRGSGIKGLAGIPPTRNHGVVRPLIRLSRAEILDYLNKNRITFVEDATNKDQAYLRNRIRHHLLPLLRSTYNTNIVDILNRTAHLCREEETWLNHHLRPLLDKTVVSATNDRLELHLSVLASEPLAVQRRLIRGALNHWRGSLRRISIYHIDTLIGLIAEGSERKRMSLPYNIEAKRGANHLVFAYRQRSKSLVTSKSAGFSYHIADIDSLPECVDLPESNYRLIFEQLTRPEPREPSLYHSNQAWFDLDKLDFPLVIRYFKPGDRINPYGMRGTKKVKKLFIDKKIPLDQRPKIPILANGESILWIAGIRRSNEAVLTKKTTRMLRVKVIHENMSPSSGTPQKAHSHRIWQTP